MTYTDTLAAFAAATETVIVALHDRYESGEIGEAQFVALATAVLIRAGAQGAALADLALAAVLTVQRQRPVPALGLTAPEDTEQRARTAVTDTLTGHPYRADPRAAVAVLARAESLSAAQNAYAAGMPAHGVTAWTRVLNADACELCQELAGPVLPASAEMFHHKGCGCTQQPVEETRP